MAQRQNMEEGGHAPSGQPGCHPGLRSSSRCAPPGHFAPTPVVQQPTGSAPQGGWMNIHQGSPGIPPGLEYLTQIDQLLVHQKIELLEVIFGFETKNKYAIKNSMGQEVYFAAEESDCCSRYWCGALRALKIKILDNYKNEVIRMDRPLACGACCCPCCLQSMEVSSPPGTVVGTIEQEWSVWKPKFQVKNAAGDTVLRIEGPGCCHCRCCSDIDFKILSTDGVTQVGKITKQWSGLAHELSTDADNFGITFPPDLDVKMKAVLLGACFLIDYMFFEEKGSA